jgi:hypothetical protein
MHLISTPTHGTAGFNSYEAQRQFADARAVSRLSPYIHFGQLRLVQNATLSCHHSLAAAKSLLPLEIQGEHSIIQLTGHAAQHEQ